jgi:heme-degrading monooxygenase HmoA
VSPRVRVIVYSVTPDDDPDAVEAAYHRICADLKGTPGLLGNELLRRVDDNRRFAVMSEWESLSAFRAWESGPDHRGATAPLRPYHDSAMPAAIYEVAAAYGPGYQIVSPCNH